MDQKRFSDSEWIKENITFFTKHHRFYTDYALTNWQQTKDKNLSGLYKSLKKLKKEEKKHKVKKEELALKKNKAKTPERGVETMFRVTLRNHITLSNIADTKANILLSVNAIIVSLVLANLIPKLDNPSNTYLIYPTAIFVLFTITAIILSVLPLSNLAFFPAIAAFIFGLAAFYFSNKEKSSKETIQLIFLLTIIALSISTYKSIFNTNEVGNTEELQEREKEYE